MRCRPARTPSPPHLIPKFHIDLKLVLPPAPAPRLQARPAPPSPLDGGRRLFIFGTVQMNKATTEPAYNYKVVRQFAIMTVVWGVIGMGWVY